VKIYLSHSAADAGSAAALLRLLVASEHTVLRSTSTDGPGDIMAKIMSSEGFVSYLLHPEPDNSVELGIALGAGIPTILVGAVGEPSVVDAFDLPSVAPTGSPVLDAHAVMTILERLPPTRRHRLPPTSLSALVADPETLDSIDSDAFEQLVWQWFISSGAELERVGPLAGADFRLHHDNREFLVEVKKRSRQGRVPVDGVRSLAHAVQHSGSAGGLLITSSPLTSAARSIAEESAIAVLTPPELVAFSSLGELVETLANKALHGTAADGRPSGPPSGART
jgi:hypothetical protein